VKSIHIDFVPNSSWRWIWATAGLFILGIVGVSVWQFWQAERHLSMIRGRVSALQLGPRYPLPPVSLEDRREKSAGLAAKQLQRDPNKAFAVIENLDAPGARLKTFKLDAASDILQLEYELDSVTVAPILSNALNAGYEPGPWQLESLTAVTKGSTAGVIGSLQVFRSMWIASLREL
jgi:hypothetical protein